MEAILALQRQLAAVQEQTQTARLSDRNIVEIIDSLTKNYDFRLIYTVDGMEYLTSEHLERQIKEVVLDHGCINIVELPKILNIGIERIEPRVDSMCKKNSELMNMNGLLLTNNYLDDVCEEINEDLQQRHNIPISDFAIKYSLPQDFLLNALTARIDTIVQGQIRNNTLQTKSYQNMIKSRLRGTLRACIRPISINQLSAISGIEESTINVILEELLRQDEIDGIVKQGTFISARFLKNQEHIIRKFYQENSYIEYDFLVKNLFIQKPKEILAQIFKDDCLFLSTCCFSKTSLEHIKEQIVDTLNLEGAIDVTCLLPSILEQEEVETIINKHLGLEDCDLIETMIFRHSYLQKCTEAFKEKIIENMYKAPQKVIEKEEPKKKGGKGKKKGESENELFSKEEVMKHLRDNKLLGSDYNPDEEELLYKLLKERLQQYYQTIKVDLFEKKKNLSSDFINEVQMKLDERINTVAFIDKAIETVRAKSTSVDISYVKDKVSTYLRPILENMIFLYCKKYSIQISSSFLNKDTEESKEADLSDSRRLKLEEPYMFKSKEALISVLETLPKDLQKLLKQLHGFIGEKKLHEACEFLQKNALDLGIKPVNVDKKNEKNFIHAQRFFTKEDMRGVNHDPKLQFFYTLVLLGLEQNLFFGLSFDEKVVSIYCSILKDDTNVPEEARKDIQKAMHLFNETSDESVKEFEAINKHLKNFYKSN